METLRKLRRERQVFFYIRPEFNPVFNHFEENERHPDDINTFAGIMSNYFQKADFIRVDPFKYLKKQEFINDIHFICILMNQIGQGDVAFQYACANGCVKSVNFLLRNNDYLSVNGNYNGNGKFL